MHEFEANFGKWIVRYRWWVIAIVLASVVAAAYGGKNLSLTTNYRVFFGADNPQLKAFDQMERTYSKEDNVLLLLAPKNGKVFTRKTLAAVEELTTRAWQTPFSTRVDSITNFQHTEAQDDDLIVRDLVEDAQGLTERELDQIKDVALAEPLLLHRLVSDSAHVTAVNITVLLPGIDEATETPSVTRFARDLAQDVRNNNPEIDVYVTGMVLMNNAFTEASQKDIKALVPASFLLMLCVLTVLLRNITGTIATLLVILCSIATAMGIGGYLGIPITPPSASAPTIILTLAIASSVHVIVTVLHEMQQGAKKDPAIIESLRVNLQPVLLTSLTTMIGFLSMNFSDSPPFQQLGNLVAMGVAASFVMVVTLLPAILSVLPLRVRAHAGKRDATMERFADFVVRRRTGLLRGMVIVSVILVLFITKNELNDMYTHYFDESVPFRTDTDFVDENLGGLYRIDFSLDSKQSSGINDPEFLHDVERFSNWWKSQPEATHVYSLTDTMKRLNRNMHGDDDEWYRMPDQRDLAAQYLLLYEMSLPYGLDLNNQINVDKSSTRLSVSIRTLSTNEILALIDRVELWLKENAPRLAGAEGISPTVMFSYIGKRNIQSMLVGTTVALILISILLIIALRSARIGLISMIPNLGPAAIGFGVWGIFVGEIGLALSIVTGMTLGIVVDDTIHFLSKYLRARRENGLDPEDAVRYAFSRVGKALWVTTLVLVAGFLVLSMSAFKLNSDMGLLTAVVIAIALAVDFLLLPPLLMKVDKIDRV